MDQVLSQPADKAQSGARHRRPLSDWAGRHPVILALALAVCAAAGWGAWRLTHPGPTRTFVTVPLDRGPISRSITASGTVNPVLTVTVGSYVSGVIQSVSCDYNTRVKRGQVCAQIDPRPYQTVVEQDQAALAQARAQLAKDQANLAYAEVSFQRNAALLAQNSISKDAVDLARSARDQAVAQVALDQAVILQKAANLDAAQVNLDYTKIVSPVDGTVVSRNITQGQTVAASFQTPTLFLIAADLTKMQVDANVSESDVGGSGAALKEGDRATFTVDAYPGQTFHGKVVQLRQAPQSVQNVITYDAVVGFDNTDLLLKPGMTATVRIITAERDGALRAPNAALRFQPGGAAQRKRGAEAGRRVFVLRDGKPEAVPVSVGLADDSYTEVTGGQIQPGDKVVVSEEARDRAARGAAPRPSLRL